MNLREEYLDIGDKNTKENREKKDEVACRAFESITSIGGRFIGRDQTGESEDKSQKGRLYVLHERFVRDKIKQAFRDLYIPLSADWYKQQLHNDCAKDATGIRNLKRFRLREILIHIFGQKKKDVFGHDDEALKETVVSLVASQKR